MHVLNCIEEFHAVSTEHEFNAMAVRRCEAETGETEVWLRRL